MSKKINKQPKSKSKSTPSASQLLDASRMVRKPHSYIVWNNFNNDHDFNVNEWDLALLRSRARDLFYNTGPVRSAISEMAYMAVGDGWLLKSNSGDLSYKKTVEDFIKNWVTITEFHKTLLTLIKMYLRDGDCLVYLTTYKGGKYPKIKVIPAHKISNGRHPGVVADGPYKGLTISKGVIFNKEGEPVAYNVVNPGLEDVQISTVSCQLILENEESDQFRGISALRDSVIYWEDIRDIQSFETQGIKTSASKALIINAPTKTAIQLSEDTDNPFVNHVTVNDENGQPKQVKQTELRGGEVVIFDNSEGNGEMKQVDTNRPTQNVQEFVKELIRLAMCGLRWPMEFATHLDMGGATAKTLFPKVQERINEIQQIIVLPLWRRVMTYVIAKATKEGYLPLNNDWLKFEPTYPGEFCYEQLKDVKSDIELMKWGVISPQYVAEKYGFVNYEGLVGKYEWLKKAKELTGSDMDISPKDLVQLWPNQSTEQPAEEPTTEQPPTPQQANE